MVAKNSRPKRSNGKTPIVVGKTLRIRLGNQKRTGVIVEDHGNLAPGGKHLYRLQFGKGEDCASILATAADLRAMEV